MRREIVEYYAYKPDKGWCFSEVLKIAMVCIVIALLFYDRVFVAPCLLPVGILIWRFDKKKYKKSVQDRLRDEFKEFITLLSGSLNAGYSLEKAIRMAYEDLAEAGDFPLFTKELAVVINGLNLNRDVEDLLMDLGKRCEEENILELAGLIATAKEYGGNMNTLINKTRKKLNDKLLVEKEIDTLVAAKRLEGYIMLVMPFGIMLYMRITNGPYIDALYHSVSGNIVATLALVVVCGCGLIIKKITEIEV